MKHFTETFVVLNDFGGEERWCLSMGWDEVLQTFYAEAGPTEPLTDFDGDGPEYSCGRYYGEFPTVDDIINYFCTRGWPCQPSTKMWEFLDECAENNK